MPFDGTHAEVDIIADCLVNGREQVRRHWGFWKWRFGGKPVCAMTALCLSGDFDGRTRDRAGEALQAALGVSRYDELFQWNDRWYRRRIDVLRLYDRAIAMRRWQ